MVSLFYLASFKRTSILNYSWPLLEREVCYFFLFSQKAQIMSTLNRATNEEWFIWFLLVLYQVLQDVFSFYSPTVWIDTNELSTNSRVGTSMHLIPFSLLLVQSDFYWSLRSSKKVLYTKSSSFYETGLNFGSHNGSFLVRFLFLLNMTKWVLVLVIIIF